MNCPLYFLRTGGFRLKIAPEAVGQLLPFRQLRKRDPEAGGVLLGRHLHEGGHVVVDEVTTPMPEDRATRFTFHRSAAPHQRVIDEVWSRSGGSSVYLGEWHTHPEPEPHPSPTDLADWRSRLSVSGVEAPYLFFLIIGQEQVAAWEGSRPAGPLQPLPQPASHPIYSASQIAHSILPSPPLARRSEKP
jgi:integrative and conjugative element protein (TIGR02256 family)